MKELEQELREIKSQNIRNGTRIILTKYEEKIRNAPPSVSGKHHPWEPTCLDHLKRVFMIVKELSVEFNVTGQELDILYSATLLHDTGHYAMIHQGQTDVKGQPLGDGWKYYETTGWARKGDPETHPILSSLVIATHHFECSRQVQNLVESHMSHWYARKCRAPQSLLEFILCASDYLSSCERLKIEYVGEGGTDG